MRSSEDRELIDDESTSIPDDTDSYTGIRNFACPSVRRADTVDSPLRHAQLNITDIGRTNPGMAKSVVGVCRQRGLS